MKLWEPVKFYRIAASLSYKFELFLFSKRFQVKGINVDLSLMRQRETLKKKFQAESPEWQVSKLTPLSQG